LIGYTPCLESIDHKHSSCHCVSNEYNASVQLRLAEIGSCCYAASIAGRNPKLGILEESAVKGDTSDGIAMISRQNRMQLVSQGQSPQVQVRNYNFIITSGPVPLNNLPRGRSPRVSASIK
jgi:hypothetical protein